MQDQELVFITVQLPKPLKSKARVQAAQENRSLSDLVRDALIKFLQEQKEGQYANGKL